MFALKIFVITSAILNVGLSASQCGSDEVVEFYCQEPTCSSHVDGGLSTVRPRLSSKQLLGIVGFNEHNFLVKSNKDEFSIVGKHSVQLIKFANKKYWQHKVNIHKTTFEVCDSTNQSNKINHYAQTNINTDTTVATDTTGQTNDPVNTSRNINDASLYVKEDNENSNNETDFDVTNNELDEDLDELVKIESEDELNLNTNNLATMDSHAENLVNESHSVNSDQNSNLKPVSSDENNLSEITNQNNAPKPISPQQLENDSSTDCTLDSCESDSNTLPKEPKENIVTEEPTEDTQTTQQSPVVEELNNSKKNQSIICHKILISQV